MLRFALLFSLILGHLPLSAQVTFNHRYHFGSTNCVLTSVYATDSCYYASGIVADTAAPYKTGHIFVKLSLEGEVLINKWLVSPTDTYGFWIGTMRPSPIEDNTFLIPGYYIEEDSLTKGVVLKIHAEGEHLDMVTFGSPYEPINDLVFVRPIDLFVEPNGDMVLTTNTFDYDLNIGTIYFHRMAPDGTILFADVYTSDITTGGWKILRQTDGYLIGGMAFISGPGTFNYPQRYVQLIKYSENGDFLWDYRSAEDEIRAGAYAIIEEADGSLVMISGLGYRDEQFEVTYAHTSLMKMSPSLDILWETSFQPSYGNMNYRAKEIFPQSDGGYYVAGYETFVRDTFILNDYEDDKAFLWHVSADGDSLWTRYYEFITDKPDTHWVHDVVQTSDGGYLFVGEAHDDDPLPGDPSQQAWFFKTDEYGCLVPGCQLVDVQEVAGLDLRYEVYPNPTTDWLYLYLGPWSRKNPLTISLYDQSGRLVQQTEAKRGSTTYLFSMAEQAPGAYYLQATSEGQVFMQELVVKQ